MSMTIGRCAINEDPFAGTFQVSGDVVRFSSDINAASVQECKAKMQQLAGLIDNTEEQVFPFTWSEDPSFDGFYQIRNVQLNPAGVYLSTGSCPFSIEMDKVSGFSRPQFESVCQLMVRTNAHGVTAPVGQRTAWFSSTVAEADVAGALVPYASDDGNVKYSSVAAPQSPISIMTAVPVADYYKASAKIEVSYDSGTTWWPIVGQQIPQSVGVYWRISNGLVRMFSNNALGGTDPANFYVETYSTGSWQSYQAGGSAMPWYMTNGFATAISMFSNPSNPGSVRVVRNTPEMVTVRTKQQTDGGAVVDWTVRRGDIFIEVAIRQPPSATAIGWGVRPFGGGSPSAFAGGVSALANDTGGRRWLVSTPVASAWGVATFEISAASRSAQFQITSDYVVGTFSNVQMRDRFLAARSERVRVVAR